MAFKALSLLLLAPAAAVPTEVPASDWCAWVPLKACDKVIGCNSTARKAAATGKGCAEFCPWVPEPLWKKILDCSLCTNATAPAAAETLGEPVPETSKRAGLKVKMAGGFPDWCRKVPLGSLQYVPECQEYLSGNPAAPQSGGSCANWCQWVPQASWGYTPQCHDCGAGPANTPPQNRPESPAVPGGECANWCQWTPGSQWQYTPECKGCGGEGVRDFQQCGVLGGPLRTARIVHGKDADQCAWRWQVSVRNARGAFCGGTLIAPGWVLTAAHCVEKMDGCKMRGLRIVAGDWKQKSDDEAIRGQSVERRVKNVYTNPRYEAAVESDFDMALVELDEAMPVNECIGVACLPENGRNEVAGTECSITGWGSLRSQGPTPEILQQASVSLLSNQKCEEDYASTHDTITSSMLCAAGNSDKGITDTCNGDSGGPLVCEESGRYTVRGVTSWGAGCAMEGYPGVYSRVSSALSWIHDVMGGRGQTSDNNKDTVGVDFGNSMWAVLSGRCTKDASNCILSPGYPGNYPSSWPSKEDCKIAVDVSAAVPIKVEAFSSEAGFDQLFVNCKGYSGIFGPEGVLPETTIHWQVDSDTVSTGWKICPSSS